MNQRTLLPIKSRSSWQHCCPNCGSLSYYVVVGTYRYNPERIFKRGARKPKPKGFRCRKCKSYFSEPRDKLSGVAPTPSVKTHKKSDTLYYDCVFIESVFALPNYRTKLLFALFNRFFDKDTYAQVYRISHREEINRKANERYRLKKLKEN